jgi:hypothetical protein
MKVGFERRETWVFTGKRPLTKFSCSFIVKAVPVFTAKLLPWILQYHFD